MKGKLISVEGIDHAGKGTQIDLMIEYLRSRGIKVEQNREPGGTFYGESMRLLLKHPKQAIPALFEKFAGHSDCPGINLTEAIAENTFERSPQCELMMFAAARAEYARMLEIELNQGTNVISDRLTGSTRAYQGGGRFGGDKAVIELIDKINRFVMNGIWPEMTLFIDIPVEVMIERGRKESDEKNAFFEANCNAAFFERVRAEYLKIAKEEPERFFRINGNRPIVEVFSEIKNCLDYLFQLS